MRDVFLEGMIFGTLTGFCWGQLLAIYQCKKAFKRGQLSVPTFLRARRLSEMMAKDTRPRCTCTPGDNFVEKPEADFICTKCQGVVSLDGVKEKGTR